ncbi:WG repeat-containing protein [Salinisphaera sp. Q1T1-3]|uniref:WG repeat-containing protein n=1 Tax=Salinisphaera sp. Q1T1-3 TaxID=2321229 RepID=UPI00131474F4|nr:WG repeat-containing protein [Salinisphaera sp. Q1T1-3]
MARAETPAGESAKAPRLLPICAGKSYDSACGLLRRDGTWAVTPRYGALYARDDGWRFMQDGRSGLLDPDGKPWLDARYKFIGAFHDERAKASSSTGNYGYIDRQGQWIVEPTYLIAKSMHDGLAPVCKSGREDGDSGLRCHYIDRDGKRAFDGDFADAEPFEHGVAVVQPIGSNTISLDGRRIGVIDTEGHMRIDYAARNALSVVGPDRIIEATPERYALIDFNDKTLFRVSHDGVLRDASPTLMTYRKLPGQHYGLRNKATTDVVVAPENGYASWPVFEHGTATARSAGDHGRLNAMLIDTQGNVLIEPGQYNGIGPFYEGVGPVSAKRYEWQLVTIDGEKLTDAVFRQIEPAWQSAPQTRRTGDVWEAVPIDAPGDHVWLDNRGQTIARVTELDCGVEIVKNGDGQRIWPKQLDEKCE